jgi:hypothetical protein
MRPGLDPDHAIGRAGNERSNIGAQARGGLEAGAMRREDLRQPTRLWIARQLLSYPRLGCPELRPWWPVRRARPVVGQGLILAVRDLSGRDGGPRLNRSSKVFVDDAPGRGRAPRPDGTGSLVAARRRATFRRGTAQGRCRGRVYSRYARRSADSRFGRLGRRSGRHRDAGLRRDRRI